jgi:hypothetical protein
LAYELKDGQGSLFMNDKGGNEKRPDRRGELNIGGVIYKLSGWLKDGSKGQWLSLKAEVKETTAPAEQQRTAPAIDDDSSVPF